MWQQYNPNPDGLQVGDCVIRAVTMACGMTWEDAYLALCMEGYRLHDLPNANRVWGHYLQEHGFTREWLPESCPVCYTVAQFASDHPQGTYILAIDGHAVCVQDGCWFDSWDSRDRVPLYAWHKKE